MQTFLDAARYFGDTRQRRRAYGEVTKLLADDVPYMWLYFPKEYDPIATRVHGFVQVPDGIMRFRAVSLSP